MPAVHLGNVEIYYEEHGSGEPVLLAPPSWWPCDTWKVSVVPALEKKYRAIIFDPRGTGFSSKPDHGYTIRQFARDAIGLVEALGISRCHAVGFALGGQIVQAMAIERPDLVASLTMAAVGSGRKAGGEAPGQDSNDDERQIRSLGFDGSPFSLARFTMGKFRGRPAFQ